MEDLQSQQTNISKNLRKQEKVAFMVEGTMEIQSTTTTATVIK